jgi:hypothetical protein
VSTSSPAGTAKGGEGERGVRHLPHGPERPGTVPQARTLPRTRGLDFLHGNLPRRSPRPQQQDATTRTPLCSRCGLSGHWLWPASNSTAVPTGRLPDLEAARRADQGAAFPDKPVVPTKDAEFHGCPHGDHCPVHKAGGIIDQLKAAGLIDSRV